MEVGSIFYSKVRKVDPSNKIELDNGNTFYIQPMIDYFIITATPPGGGDTVLELEKLLNQKILLIADTGNKGRYCAYKGRNLAPGASLHQRITEENKAEWKTNDGIKPAADKLTLLTDTAPYDLIYGGCGYDTPMLQENLNFLDLMDPRIKVEKGGFEPAKVWHSRALGKYQEVMNTYQDRLKGHGVMI